MRNLATNYTNRSTNPRLHHAATRLALAVTVLLTLAACADTATVTAPTPAPSSALEAASFDVGALLVALSDPSGPDVAELALAALPSATHTTERQVANLHDPHQTDTLRTLSYPGVAVEVYEVGHSSSRFLKSVRVERNDVEFAGLRVGMPAATVRQALANETLLFEEGAVETYLLSPTHAAPVQVSVRLENGALAAFTVHGYLD